MIQVRKSMAFDKAFLEVTLVKFPENDTSKSDEELKKALTEYVQGEMEPNTTIASDTGLWCLVEQSSEVDSLMGEALSFLREDDDEEESEDY